MHESATSSGLHMLALGKVEIQMGAQVYHPHRIAAMSNSQSESGMVRPIETVRSIIRHLSWSCE